MSVKKINPLARHTFVSTTDDAIDESKSNLDEYRKDQDLKHIVLLDGKNPTYFVAKSVTPEDDIDIKDMHMKIDFTEEDPKKKLRIDKWNSMMVRYFKAGVLHTKEGDVEEKMDYKCYGSNILIEIGSFVFNASQPSVATKKK